MFMPAPYCFDEYSFVSALLLLLQMLPICSTVGYCDQYFVFSFFLEHVLLCGSLMESAPLSFKIIMKCLFYCLTELCLVLSSSYVTLFCGLVFTVLDSHVCTVSSGPRLVSCQAPARIQTTPTCLSPDPTLPVSHELNFWGRSLRKPFS